MSEDYIQLDMYDNTEMDFIKAEIKLALNKGNLAITRTDTVRKGLFARHNELDKRITLIEEENQNLKKNLSDLQDQIEFIRETLYGKYPVQLMVR